MVSGVLVERVGEMLGGLVELAADEHLVAQLLVPGGGLLLLGGHLRFFRKRERRRIAS